MKGDSKQLNAVPPQNIIPLSNIRPQAHLNVSVSRPVWRNTINRSPSNDDYTT